MDKNIIIDGVNVAGCEFFEPKAQVMQCHRGAITQRCKENNCYFKQFKRLEQENFALTQESQQKSQTICELEQENRELKEKYSHILELAKTNADSNEYCLQELERENETWQKTCEVLKEQAQLDGECIDKLIEVRDMYAKALEEIREIADKCKECLNEDDDCGCDYLRIKRRIDEVLGND